MTTVDIFVCCSNFDICQFWNFRIKLGYNFHKIQFKINQVELANGGRNGS